MHKDVHAGLFSIGTEITEGVIQDTHGRFLSSELTALGIQVDKICALRDGPEAADTLQSAIEVYDLVIITGGLGPTADDITRDAVAEAAGVQLLFNSELWSSIERRYSLSKAKANRRQAHIPAGFTAIENDNGTAPGFWGDVRGSMVAALPGPPRELQPMFFSTVKSGIISFFDVEVRESTELSTFLIPEAVLEDVCAEIDHGDVLWRTRFQPYKISLYLEGGTEEERDRCVERLQRRFGEELVRRGEVETYQLLSAAARDRVCRIASAESCTGGLVAKLITDFPGSSDIFWGSFVTYSDEAKKQLLGVEEKTLNTCGAVSLETAGEMAEGALDKSGADVAIAVSGIAGPSGGSAEKPVGTVCFAVAGKEFDTRAWTLSLGSWRDLVRRRSAVAAALILEIAIRAPGSLDRVDKWHYS